MTYLVVLWGSCFVRGALAVASNLSLYYGVLGLVVGLLVGCSWLVSLGASFISLAVYLVYLGGMIVVFVYSVSADPYPETWGDLQVLGFVVV
ncbi:NU6M oxidoreductase, partial [Crypturellus undulatus]|nr:NU6M oxidoreductase [Crypturellus undulatus]